MLLALALSELMCFVSGTLSGSTRLFHEDLVTVQREHTARNEALFFDVSHFGGTVASVSCRRRSHCNDQIE